MDRKEEVVLTRLRIGHSYATHSYLLKEEEQPMYIPCDTPFTIKHVLLYCVDFETARNRYYRVSTLKDLFESVEISNIFLYLKPRAGPGVERIGRTPPPLAQSVETWPIGVRLVCRELRPVSLEERILVIERVGCCRHATHYFGLNFS